MHRDVQIAEMSIGSGAKLVASVDVTAGRIFLRRWYSHRSDGWRPSNQGIDLPIGAAQQLCSIIASAARHGGKDVKAKAEAAFLKPTQQQDGEGSA